MTHDATALSHSQQPEDNEATHVAWFAVAGLTEDLLMEAARLGDAAAADKLGTQSGGFYASNAAGTSCQMEATAALREGLHACGWTPEEVDGLTLAVSPCGGRCVAVATGDGSTGVPGATAPRTRSKKGLATIRAIKRNAQLHLPGFGGALPMPVPRGGRQFWVVLVHRDEHRDEVRYELSLPQGVSPGGFIDLWAHRLLLGAVSDAGLPDIAPPSDTSEDGPEIDIQPRE